MSEIPAGMTAELYRAVVAIMDERLKEIRVTREDFDELKGAVKELVRAQVKTESRMGRLEQAIEKLAQVQARTETRMDRLERAVEKLAEAQARTEKRVEELTQAQARTEMRVDRLEQAMEKLAQAQARTEQRVEELAQAQARTEQRTEKLDQAIEKLAQAQARTEKALANLAHQVGRLSDTLGYGLEDLGQWILPAYFERTYGIAGVKKCTRKFIKVDSREVEVNLYAKGRRNGEVIVLLGEAKNRIGRTEVKNFIKRLRTLRPVFDQPIFSFIFGYWAHPSAQRLAKENDIEVICSYQLTRGEA